MKLQVADNTKPIATAKDSMTSFVEKSRNGTAQAARHHENSCKKLSQLVPKLWLSSTEIQLMFPEVVVLALEGSQLFKVIVPVRSGIQNF